MNDTPIVRAADCNLSFLDGVAIAKTLRGQRYKNDRRYLDIISAFDIETSIYNDADGGPHSYMYIWQWQLGEVCTVIGRTWAEFLEFWGRLIVKLDEQRCLMVFVHNLSYEFQFLAGVLDMTGADIFATDLRKILYCRIENVEFRCSMRLSNCSLGSWTAQLGVDHQKLSGDEFNYTETRYPWVELTERQMQYCVNDVVGLVECIQRTLEMHSDSLYSLPMTSTGYIRRMVKKAVFRELGEIRAQQDTLHVYDALRLAYRGGDTHANRFEVGNILDTVYSYDRSSSYPDVMVHCKYPVTKFRAETDLTLDGCAKLTRLGRAYLARVEFYLIRVKPWNTCPYISFSKCIGGELSPPLNYKLDNGRILSADYVQLWLTDIDLRMILNEYDINGDIRILELYSARYGYLPQPIRDVIKQLYTDKTTLKNVEGAEERYLMSKQLLNSVYGMMCQRVITPAVQFVNGEWVYDVTYNREHEYNKRTRKSFLAYHWGVWVCAWARLRLHQGIDCAGWDDFIYCDTDSVKALTDLDIDKFNRARIEDAKRSGAYAVDPKGVTHYMGVFEKEETYDHFVTLGAKRYAYDIDGELGMTVAGVSKKRGYRELEKLGGLPAFREGVTFNEAGHISAFYNDYDDIELEIDGHLLHIGRNVALVERPYTLTLSDDLREAIKNVSKLLDKLSHEDYNDSAFRQ